MVFMQKVWSGHVEVSADSEHEAMCKAEELPDDAVEWDLSDCKQSERADLVGEAGSFVYVVMDAHPHNKGEVTTLLEDEILAVFLDPEKARKWIRKYMDKFYQPVLQWFPIGGDIFNKDTNNRLQGEDCFNESEYAQKVWNSYIYRTKDAVAAMEL